MQATLWNSKFPEPELFGSTMLGQEPTLLSVLQPIARACGHPESIDLHTHLVQRGAEAHGQMQTQLFRSCLDTVFSRIHFSEGMMQVLIKAYGVGYQAPRTGPLGDSTTPTHVAWQDVRGGHIKLVTVAARCLCSLEWPLGRGSSLSLLTSRV